MSELDQLRAIREHRLAVYYNPKKTDVKQVPKRCSGYLIQSELLKMIPFDTGITLNELGVRTGFTPHQIKTGTAYLKRAGQAKSMREGDFTIWVRVQ